MSQSTKPGKPARKPTAAAKRAAKQPASCQILSAPKGYRTLTHQDIVRAVETVIRQRGQMGG